MKVQKSELVRATAAAVVRWKKDVRTVGKTTGRRKERKRRR